MFGRKTNELKDISEIYKFKLALRYFFVLEEKILKFPETLLILAIILGMKT